MLYTLEVEITLIKLHDILWAVMKCYNTLQKDQQWGRILWHPGNLHTRWFPLIRDRWKHSSRLDTQCIRTRSSGQSNCHPLPTDPRSKKRLPPPLSKIHQNAIYIQSISKHIQIPGRAGQAARSLLDIFWHRLDVTWIYICYNLDVFWIVGVGVVFLLLITSFTSFGRLT